MEFKFTELEKHMRRAEIDFSAKNDGCRLNRLSYFPIDLYNWNEMEQYFRALGYQKATAPEKIDKYYWVDYTNGMSVCCDTGYFVNCKRRR